MHWAQGKVGGAVDWARDKAGQAGHWLGEKAHSGLEWVNKTGVVGAIGRGLKTGLHVLGEASKYTPIGMAVRAGMSAGKWMKGGGLSRVWDKTKHLAGKAWEGVKSGYKATANFLQSPAGQLLVTGLSLAASFIPGGLVVKAISGGGIGAIQAISEGKDWKGILAGAAGGALTGALPFLKIGPLAKMGIGALQGGIGALASGGSMKDALKGAVGGAVDNFSPGALKSLGKIKGISAAGKLLGGGKLSKAEKAFMGGSKLAGPLRGLEKLVSRPGVRGGLAKLEKMGGKAIKGGIWVSGKAAKAQGVLDKVVSMGDKVHGALSQVHDLAPGLSEALGDNAVGNFVGRVGDLAGQGDEKLSKALEYGHTASDKMTEYRGYLDKGLGYAGVKDPSKAYEKMMARKGLAKGKRGSMEEVGRLKLEDHKRKHPELHPLAEASGKKAPERPHVKPETALQRALAKGREVHKKGIEVAQGVHDGLGKVHGWVGKGIATADKVQSGLEKASELARQGAGIFGADSEIGKHLLHAAQKADSVHEHIGAGLDAAKDFNEKVGKVQGWTEKIHGVDKDGKKKPHEKKTPLEQAVHLEGGKGKGKEPAKKSPHDPAHGHDKGKQIKTSVESEEQKKARYSKAWDKLTTVSRTVQQFESRYSKTILKIHEMMRKGQSNAASLELMGLGSNCDEVSRYIQEAVTLSKGNDKLEKEAKFYANWHKETKAKLHKLIADTKGLGDQTAISGFGISEATHPDIFQNTREIFAIQGKVIAFGNALHDSDAHEHVKKVLADAKRVKADLQALKSKYKKDKKAKEFLTGGGSQDKLIDDSIAKLEKALKGESHEPHKPAPGKVDPHKKPEPEKKKPVDMVRSVEHGLKVIDRYRKRAVRTGRKIDHGLTKIENALGKGIRIGRKVDKGLGQIAGLADQVSGLLGEDTPLGHLAQEVGQDASAGQQKLNQVLDTAGKGKGFLKSGHDLFRQGLQIAAGHHEKRVKAIHGLPGQHRPHHVSPHGPSELDHVMSEGKHLVHGGEKFWKDGKHAVKDAQHMWKDGKEAWGDARHFGQGASHMFGDVKKMVHGDHKHLGRDLKNIWGEGKQLFGEGKHLFQEGKDLFQQGKNLWGEGAKLWGQGKDLIHEGKHVVEDVSHLIHKGKDWVVSNLDKLHLGGVTEQAKKAWGILPEWLKGIFGGGEGKPSPHDPLPPHHRPGPHHHPVPGPGPAPAPHADSLSEAECAAVVQSAQGWVTSFGKEVGAALKEIEQLMQAGDTKGAGNRVHAVSGISEQTRAEVTRAVKATAKYPALHRQAQAASRHYLEIRRHFFKFVQSLHGLGGAAADPGVDAAKYPDLAGISAEIGSLQVKVDALGQLKNADTPMQEHVKALRHEASELRTRLQAARAHHRHDKAAAEIISGLASKLSSIEGHLGGHGSKRNVQRGDSDLGIEGEKRPPQQRGRRRRKRKHHIHVNRRGQRGDVDVHDGQEVDAASADTWIGSGEGVKMFSEVFGAFLPAEGAMLHGGGEAHDQPGEEDGDHPLVPGHGGEDEPRPHQRRRRRRRRKGGILGKVGKFVGGLGKKVSGFFHGLFEHLHSFADTIGGWAHKGASLLGQGMHFAEMGMHGLSFIEKSAEKVQGIAGKAEGFLEKMGLGKAAGFARQIGGAAGWVDKEAKTVHGGLRTADQWMGKGKKFAGQVEGGAGRAGGIFGEAEHGRFGSLLQLFKSSRGGDGIDGKLTPEKVRMGSVLDEPQRLDISTMHRMETYLGGDFAGVRLHTGPGAADITKRFNAEAVTVKDHIFFAPGRFNAQSVEGQRLLAHELTHVMQKGRSNLDVRTAEGEALHSEHNYGHGPQMQQLNLSKPQPGFRLADGEGMGNSSGVHTAKRNRSKGHEVGGMDSSAPDGEDFLEQVSGRVYELLMEELEHAFESR
jgi:hypothetical protein